MQTWLDRAVLGGAGEARTAEMSSWALGMDCGSEDESQVMRCAQTKNTLRSRENNVQ